MLYNLKFRRGFEELRFAAVKTEGSGGIFRLHTRKLYTDLLISDYKMTSKIILEQYLKALGHHTRTLSAHFEGSSQNVCIIINFDEKLPTSLSYQLRNSSNVTVSNKSVPVGSWSTKLELGIFEAEKYVLNINVETEGLIVNIKACKSKKKPPRICSDKINSSNFKSSETGSDISCS
jgi:hypothetical protein